MTTPRARTLVVSLAVSTTVASALMLASTAAAQPRHRVAVAHPISRTVVAPDPHGDQLMALVNRTRDLRGLPMLHVDARVSREALRHARAMASAGAISHTANLASIISSAGGTVFGEDVGKGRGLQGIRDAWLRRDDTRRILLDRRFHQVGVGVIHVDGFYWVTLQVFD